MPPTPGGIFCFKGRPVSRVLWRCVSCERILHRARHLSCRAIADAVIRPTPRLGRAALGRRYTWSFNPSGVRLPMSPPGPVSSYLTFSPLTRGAGLFFSVTLLYPFGYLPVRKDGALCCPDFPPRCLRIGTTDRPAGTKITIYCRFFTPVPVRSGSPDRLQRATKYFTDSQSLTNRHHCFRVNI